MDLPWNEQIAALSIDPDRATREVIARLASELLDCQEVLIKIKTWCELNRREGSVIYPAICKVLKSCDL